MRRGPVLVAWHTGTTVSAVPGIPRFFGQLSRCRVRKNVVNDRDRVRVTDRFLFK